MTIQSSLIAQTQRRIFEHLTIEDGLSQNSVYSILQDKYGIMWFGTEAGLNKYDGYNFSIYTNDSQDSNSISNNWINCLYQDRLGNIFVGTGDGLNIYNYSKDEFTRFEEKLNNPNSINGSFINTIYGDKNGNVWIGTEKGLNKYSYAKNNFSYFALSKQNNHSSNFVNIYSIYEDNSGELWLGSENNGLFQFNPKLNIYSNFEHNPSNNKSINGNTVRFINEDKNGCMWIGLENGGLEQFDRKKQIFTHFNLNKSSLPSNTNLLRTSFYDGENNLWIGTLDRGLIHFDIESHSFTEYKNIPYDQTSLNSNIILSILKDQTGLMWFGTSGNGVNKSRISSFQYFKKEIINEKSLSHNLVWSVFEDHAGNILVGTSLGLNIFDKNGKFVETLKNEPDNSNSLSQNTVWAIEEDDEHNIWIGTSDGLNKYDRITKKITRIYLDEHDFNGFSMNRIRNLLYDSQNELWVGSENGLYNYKIKNNTWKFFEHDTDGNGKITSSFISALYEDTKNDIWIGTRDGGVNKYDRVNKNFTSFSFNKYDSNSITSNNIQSIVGDSKNNLWISTDQGINRFDGETGIISRYYSANDQLFGVVYGIVIDKQGSLWFSTNYGLYRSDPYFTKFKIFTVHDGLQSNEFNSGAYNNLKDGRLIFGGINGFNIFNPQDFTKISSPPSVKFIKVTKFGKEIKLPYPIYELKELSLSYNDNYFTIEFAVMDYTSTSKNNFFYMLEGRNTEWIGLGRKHEITFTNLSSGEYNLIVKGQNSEGVTSIEEAKIQLIILPPYWSTWWFRILSGIIILSFILSMHKLRLRKIKVLNNRLANRVQQKTKDLKETNNQLEEAKNKIEIEKEDLATTLKSIRDGVIKTDIAGKILIINKAAELILEKSAEELLQKYIYNIIRSSDENQLNLEEYLNGLQEEIVTIKIKDCQKLVQINFSGISSQSKEILGFVIVIKDVTEKINVEQQFAMSQKMESIGHLAAGISHEINTPMQFIGDNTSFLKESFNSFLNFINIIKSESSNGNGSAGVLTNDYLKKIMIDQEIDFLIEEIPPAIDQSQEGIQRVSNIVKAMKDFSHPAKKEKAYNDLNHAIEVTSTVSKNEWKYVAELELNLDPTLPNVFCLHDEMNQVILNMIVNAAHTIAEKNENNSEVLGKITISTNQEDDFVVLKISDSGKGISKENLIKIFDPFYTTKEVGKGTGQGLSIAHDIVVNKHKGYINVESVLNEGTTFVVKIPINANEN